jgi:dipeptidyl-peptidase 4
MSNGPEWINDSGLFWYRKTIMDGHKFIRVDAENRAKQPAFDHNRLAEALSEQTGEPYTGYELPFSTIKFSD